MITWIVFLHSLSDCRWPPVINPLNLPQTTLFLLSFKIIHRSDMVNTFELEAFLRRRSSLGLQFDSSGNVRQTYKYENYGTHLCVSLFKRGFVHCLLVSVRAIVFLF